MFSQIHVLYPRRATSSTTGTSTPVASQSFTVSNSAVAVTTAYVYPTTQLVTFDVQSQNVVARWDGTSPTASVGHILVAGSAFTWDVDQFNNCKFIRQGSSDAVIFCSPMTV